MVPLNLLFLALPAVVLVAVVAAAFRFLGARGGRSGGLAPLSPEDRASIEKLDDEIARLQGRIGVLEQTGGSGTWMAMMVLWRNRRRLSELTRRRGRLVEAQRRWMLRRDSATTGITAPAGRSEAIQLAPPRPLAPETFCKRDEHSP